MNGRSSRLVQAGRLFTLAVTNAIKIGGLYLALHTAATESNPNVVLIGEAIFMMSGAQITEEQILKLVARMFGAERRDEPADPPENPKR